MFGNAVIKFEEKINVELHPPYCICIQRRQVSGVLCIFYNSFLNEFFSVKVLCHYWKYVCAVRVEK